ncbi:hypothetical protein TUM3792_20900 [Shewanella sp. MBTL60-007]|nr:hypothetical protein TUM3792_20900 [Shewanella sp. MBTL60-007]
MTTWTNRQNKSIENKFKTMLGVADDIEFGDSTLSEYLFFGKQGIEMAVEKLIEVEEDWPANSGRPHALVFMVLNDYQVQNSESVFLSNEEGAVTLSFHSLIIPKESFEGEAVVMLSIARHEKTSEYMPHTIWLHPVLSTDVPLLTRTRTEKAVTKGLIATSKSSEHNFFISKPVTQISDSDADLVLGIIDDDGVKTRLLVVLNEEENDQRVNLVKEANSNTKVIGLDSGKGIVYKDVWKELELYAGVAEMFE